MSPTFDPAKTILLTLDLQPAIFKFGSVPVEILSHASIAVKWARQQGMKIIHIATGFEDGYPELPAEIDGWAPFQMWGQIRKGNLLLKRDSDTMVAEEILQAKDKVIWKSRGSAFVRASEDLDTLLREQGINHIVMFGVATSGAVLSTVRSGFDRDWRMSILRDGCWDADEDVHRCLMDKVLAERAHIISLQELIKQ